MMTYLHCQTITILSHPISPKVSCRRPLDTIWTLFAHLADNNVFNNGHCIAKSVIPHSVIYYLLDKVGLALLRLSSPMSNKNKHHSVIRIW